MLKRCIAIAVYVSMLAVLVRMIETEPADWSDNFDVGLSWPGSAAVDGSVTNSHPAQQSAGASSAHDEIAVPTVEYAIVDQINTARATEGLTALHADEQLMEAARARSADMVARGYLGHYDPATGEALPLRYCACAENIARKGLSLDWVQTTTVTDWLQSPVHRANVLGAEYGAVGVGVVLGVPGVVTALFRR